MKIIKIGALWCSSCIVVNNYWMDIKKKYPDIEFIDYDIDFDSEKVKEFNIGNKLPEIIFYEDDMEIKRIIGEKNKEEFEQELNKINEKNN